MAYSYTEYTASGVYPGSTFTSPPYLTGRGASDISVTVNGVTQVAAAYNLNGTTVTFNADYLPADGATIRISRNSSQGARLTDFNDAALLTADGLDQDSLQLFYMAQEAIDVSSETNLNGSTFYFSSATAPTTAVAGTLWYDTSTAPNALKIYNGTDWVFAAPTRTVNRYVETDMTDSGSKQYVASSAFTSQSEVYLNGIRLTEASSLANVGASGVGAGVGDYFYHTSGATPRIYVMALSSTDILEIITI